MSNSIFAESGGSQVSIDLSSTDSKFDPYDPNENESELEEEENEPPTYAELREYSNKDGYQQGNVANDESKASSSSLSSGGPSKLNCHQSNNNNDEYTHLNHLKQNQHNDNIGPPKHNNSHILENNGDDEQFSRKGRFPDNPPFIDGSATILFGGVCAFNLFLTLIGLMKGYGFHVSSTMYGIGFSLSEMVGMFFWSCLLGVTCVVPAVYATKFYAHKILLISFWAMLITLLFTSVTLFTYASSIWLSLCGVGSLCLWSLWYKACKHRIEFTSSLIEASATLLSKYPQLGILSVAAVASQGLWCLVMFVSFSVGCNWGNSGSYFLMAYSLLVFLWGCEILRNIVHVTVSGVVGRHYFAIGRSYNPTHKSLSFAVNQGFGAICLGSLLISLIKMQTHVLRLIAKRRASNRFSATIFHIMRRLLRWFEGVSSYYNYYTFVHVAIYGYNYKKAGISSFNMIRREGLRMVMNDEMTESVTRFVSMVSACISGLLIALLMYLQDHQSLTITKHFFVGFCMVYNIVGIVATVLSSSVSSLFVCYADEPDLIHHFSSRLGQKFESEKQKYTNNHINMNQAI